VTGDFKMQGNTLAGFNSKEEKGEDERGGRKKGEKGDGILTK